MSEISEFPSKFAQVVASQHAKEQAPPPPPTPGTGAHGGLHLVTLKGNNDGDGAKEQLKSIDLLRVYKTWWPGKTVSQPERKETLVSCFNESAHANGDRNPSMSINNDANVYKCFGCEIAGDIIDMVAVKNGYADGNSKCPEDMVHQAVFDASALCNTGWEFHQGKDGRYYKNKPGVDYSANSQAMPAPLTVVPSELPPPPGVIPPPPIPPMPVSREVEKLNWDAVVEFDSPLHEYMRLVTQDDCPEEYHFWNFMVLMGLIAGRDAAFEDFPVVYGNLFVCLVGGTGMGKSRSIYPVGELLNTPTLEFREDDPFSDGIKQIRHPGSGEVLTKTFQHISPDPNWAPVISPGMKQVPKRPMVEHPVRGLITFDELAALVGKSAAKGSTLKTVLMEVFDAGSKIGGSSLSGGSYEARDALGAVITTTQPSIVEELFTGQDASSGFLNRWLLIHGTPKQRHTRNKRIDLSGMDAHIKDLVTWVAEIKNTGGVLTFENDEVEEYFEEVCNKLVFKQDEKNGLQRLHLMFKKFILLMSMNNLEEKISRDSVESAEKLTEWITGANRDSGVENLGDDIFERVDTEIKRCLGGAGKDGLRPTDLRKAVKREVKSPALATVYESVYRQAVLNGDVVEISFLTGGRGRPKKVAILQRYEKEYDTGNTSAN